MNLRQVTVLLPCHSLEDFPIYHEGETADQLLAAWCGAWHPHLIAATGALAEWQRIDIPPDHLEGMLLIVPPFCEERLPAGFTTRVDNEGGRLVAAATTAGVIEQALAGLDSDQPDVDEQLAADFIALAFCRLQIELLTRQMRYTVHIDETHFSNQAVEAARAAVAGRIDESRDHLQQCFDTLYEARKHFYPVDVYLLDVTLLAETTLGDSLAAELAGEAPLNLLASGNLLQSLSDEHPGVWQSLLKAIDLGKVCVLGGDDVESPLPLLPLERALDHLRAGAQQYETLLGRPPHVYGRRRAGLTPVLPQLLAKLGYYGALHFTLDDGTFPLGPQCKTRWEGIETSVVDIFARVPSDAARPDAFLGLSRLLSDSMDTDHVATVAFAHWPTLTSPWYGVLRRIAELSSVLGKFILLDDYFMHTDMPGRLSKFTVDEYRTPYLKQAIIRRAADPLSSIAVEYRAAADSAARSALSTVCTALGAHAEGEGSPELLAALAQTLPRAEGAAAPRYLLFNPQIGTRRIGVELPELPAAPEVGGAVVAAGSSGNRKFAVVDVPSLGFAWIEAGSGKQAGRTPSIVDEHALRNEFLEVRVSSKTGGIQGVYNFNQRGNQLSQQLAYRLGSAGGADPYTTMRGESVEVTADSPAYGEIVTRGVLVDASDRPLASFQQTIGLWAGSRIVELEVKLTDVEEPRADPWNSYCGVRYAWPDDQAELYRGVSSARQKTAASRLEAPEFIDLDNGAATVTLLTGGLPYHRRSGDRMLDSLLVVRGESARSFRLGIGVDLPDPAAAAAELLQPKLLQPYQAAPPRNTTGWFFHLGAKNIISTHWEPIFEEADQTRTGPPVMKGFRVRLMEIAGTAGRVPLRALRAVQYARQIDFMGETILELYVDDDKIMLDFGPYELLEVEALWIR